MVEYVPEGFDVRKPALNFEVGHSPPIAYSV